MQTVDDHVNLLSLGVSALKCTLGSQSCLSQCRKLKGTVKWRQSSNYYRLHGFIYGAKDSGLIFSLNISKVVEIPDKLWLEKAVDAGKP